MSNKTMKGYEIFKAIANKEIKDGTQFRMLKNENIYTYRNNNFVCRYGGMNIISILNDEFEIIEEQEEMDIQDLQEYEFPGYVDIKLSPIEKKLLELINQNRQAVKQLDNKLKE
jgi:hypothetical protein